MTRKHTPAEIEADVLLKSARRCAICYGIHHDLAKKPGQIAHLDREPSNSAEDNLAFLCLEHHSEYDSKTSQHKNYTISEVKKRREALHLAVAKKEHAAGAPSLMNLSQRLGQVSDKFFDQRRSLPETALLNKIRSLPHWRLSICPTDFMEAQFLNVEQCERFMNSQTIKSNGYDYFPLMPLEVKLMQEPTLGAVTCDVDRSDLSTGVCECWTLFKSGQFVLNRTIWQRPEMANTIHAFEIVRIVSHVFEFARRMALEGVLSPKATIRITLNNVAGFVLSVPNHLVTGHSKSGLVEETIPCDPNVLETESDAMAMEVAVKLFHSFGWKEPSPSDLEPMQARFVAR